MPFFAKALDGYHRFRIDELVGIISALKIVSEFIPPGVPVMTSDEYRPDSALLGNYKTYWMDPPIYYYADRRMIYSTDINDIEANRKGCAAYILRLTYDPNTEKLAQELYDKYNKHGEPQMAAQNHLVFFLKDKSK